MRMFLFLTRALFVPLCIGFILALIASAVVQTYIQTKKDAEFVRSATDLTKVLRTGNAYTTYLTVLSYNPESHALIASVRSNAIGQNVPQLLMLDKNFSMERRDAIIQNAVIAGTKPLVPASLNELLPGTHGLGVLRLDDDGFTNLYYLLIGDPFPRP